MNISPALSPAIRACAICLLSGAVATFAGAAEPVAPVELRCEYQAQPLDLSTPIAGLDHVEAHFESLYGSITSTWQREGENIRFQITVPANTTAAVLLPGKPVSASVPGSPEPGGASWRYELKPGVFESVAAAISEKR